MHVAVIPLRDVLRNCIDVRSLPLLDQLLVAAHRPHFHTGSQIDLGLRIRKDHGADISAVHDHRPGFRKLPLKLHKLCADCGINAGSACHVSDCLGPELSSHIFPVQKDLLRSVHVIQRDKSIPRRSGDLFSIVRFDSLAQEIHRHGAVHRPRINIDPAEFPAYRLRDGGLAGARRSVNGNCLQFIHGVTSLLRFLTRILSVGMHSCCSSPCIFWAQL